MRGFAGDCMDCIAALSMFIRFVLSATHLAVKFEKHFECFACLKMITDIFICKSMAALVTLEKTQAKHHRLFLELYSALAKPKLHYARHIGPRIRELGTFLACFNFEHEHTYTKSVMRTAFRNSTKTALSYSLHRLVAAALAVKTFTEVYLAGNIKAIVDPVAQMSLWIQISGSFPDHEYPTAIMFSRSLMHSRGRFHSRQMLACLNGRGRMVVCGLAKLFIEFQLGATSSFFVLVDLYVKTASETWAPSDPKPIPIAAVLRPVPYFEVDEMHAIYVGLPSYIS